MYTIKENKSSPSADAGRFVVTLAKSCKNFSKKPIVQLQVVPEFHLLLCLADSVVTVYDLRFDIWRSCMLLASWFALTFLPHWGYPCLFSVYNLVHPMPKTRGASLLAVDVQVCPRFPCKHHWQHVSSKWLFPTPRHFVSILGGRGRTRFLIRSSNVTSSVKNRCHNSN